MEEVEQRDFGSERYLTTDNEEEEKNENASGLTENMHPQLVAVPRMRSISLNSRPTSAHYRLMQQEGIQMLTVAAPSGSSLSKLNGSNGNSANGSTPAGSGGSLSGSGTLATKGLGSGNLEDIRRGRKRTMVNPDIPPYR